MFDHESSPQELVAPGGRTGRLSVLGRGFWTRQCGPAVPAWVGSLPTLSSVPRGAHRVLSRAAGLE